MRNRETRSRMSLIAEGIACKQLFNKSIRTLGGEDEAAMQTDWQTVFPLSSEGLEWQTVQHSACLLDTIIPTLRRDWITAFRARNPSPEMFLHARNSGRAQLYGHGLLAAAVAASFRISRREGERRVNQNVRQATYTGSWRFHLGCGDALAVTARPYRLVSLWFPAKLGFCQTLCQLVTCILVETFTRKTINIFPKNTRLEGFFTLE